MTSAPITADQIWSWLGEIPDPEIPVISITDLGIVRSVNQDPEDPSRCTVGITPTYSGCPATEVIAAHIQQKLAEHGVCAVDLRIQIAPPWTTDWLSQRGREALSSFGIAPPGQPAPTLTQITVAPRIGGVACPHCGATETEVLSQFSSTPCKALYRCLCCREPFDYFKPH